MKKIFFCLLAISLSACASQPAASVEIQTSTDAPVPTAISNSPTQAPAPLPPTKEASLSFEISSPAFTNGQPIPSDFSCDGNDSSPALAWTEPPSGTQSFALIMDDPDAPMGTWVHWVIFNIPASARGLAESMPTDSQLSDGSVQGKTSAGSNGYHGPCPPSGTHRYFFKLYALDTILSLTAKADKKELLAAMEGHVLANAELMGTFKH
jgi:Raf kinase inhibitor-like YbhB/YbcL family protein